MPGFLGGSSSGSSGAGGEISFPKEFVDPVTKLRVSNPQNLIDTDFEYGLQPTKWETVELINNTPSFFSKSGDTTIPGIVAITTNAGTREITVVTALDHGLAVGIPIQVTGSKSVTADGSYIINSIPNTTTFTYLCRDDQPNTSSIEDLYTSIITGEFFQGSQLRVADSSGITTDGESTSTLTVRTESTHGFGVKTPFYFLNLNSTISQEFQAANTAAKSFDASNSATAQTFDGSNTLSSVPVDWSNSSLVGGVNSTISTVSTSNNTITVAHGTENFVGLPLGTPLYYSVSPTVGYFSTNPRGVVFLKSTDNLGSGISTFQVSEVPDGTAISIEASLSGFFRIANQAKTFAGNNINQSTQQSISIIKDTAISFEGANDGGPLSEDVFTNGNPLCTQVSYSGSLVNVSVTPNAGLGYYTGAMVRYSTTGSSASGLTNNATYFIDSFFSTGTNTFAFTIKSLPTDVSPINVSGGTGTQTFRRIGVSLDRNIWHIRNSNYSKGDLLKYDFPVDGKVVTDTTKTFLFVDTVFDSHNYRLSDELFTPMAASGGTLTQIVADGRTWNVHTITATGTTNFVVSDAGSNGYVEYLLVAGGGGGGGRHGGGGGAGGLLTGTATLTSTTYPVVVGGGGAGASTDVAGTNGGNTTFNSLTALGGGGGGAYGNAATPAGRNGGSGGGAGHAPSAAGLGTAGQGTNGGAGLNNEGGGGGGAIQAGLSATSRGGNGGRGRVSHILGRPVYFAGGGGGATWDSIYDDAGDGGEGGGGGGGHGAGYYSGAGAQGGISAGQPGLFSSGAGANTSGGSGGANTGGGGGGVGQQNNQSYFGTGGVGGSGIAVIRYPITPPVVAPSPMSATGGVTTDITVGTGYEARQYRVHTFPAGSSSFSVTNLGNIAPGFVEYLIIGGGGSGGTGDSGNDGGGGGGAGGYREGIATLATGVYPVVVGTGGAGINNVVRVAGNVGQSSSFNSITALGGGAGGQCNSPGGAGGSGGGAGGGGGPGFAGGTAGASGQGFAGGFNFAGPSYTGAGGGGAGGEGGQSGSGRPGGVGGAGRTSEITGTPITYAAGGGGGGGIGVAVLQGGAGGSQGRGGRGGNVNDGGSSGFGGAGQTPGCGSGAAGNRAYTTAAGSSGIVVIRYPLTARTFA